MTYASSEPPKEQVIPASVSAELVEQARIQGMRKVVEWIEANKKPPCNYCAYNYRIDAEALSKFLQDNNLEGKE